MPATRRFGSITRSSANEYGYRRVLDFDIANTESEASWKDVFKRLIYRGLSGVELVISDCHEGLRNAIQSCFQGASWQRCQVHFMRNISQRVPHKIRNVLLNRLSEAFESDTAQEARLKMEEIVFWLREIRQERAALVLEDGFEDTLTVYSFPSGHHRRLKSTNLSERYMREIKRRTRVVGIFPNRESLGRLVGALLMAQDEIWLCEKRYLNMHLMGPVQLQNVRCRKEAAA